MIDGLSDSTRALLDAARQGLAPDALAVKRVHARVAATTGGILAGIGAKLLVVALHETAAIEAAHAGAAIARVEAPPPAHRAAPLLVVVEHHADLAREVALIDAAMHADARGALAVLQIYDTETAGRGQMAEDAAAIAIESHCRLHDDVAAKLAAFDARWPSSAQRARVTEACR